jgi:hypothetical protein
MEDVTGKVDAVFFKEVLKDGAILIVIARKVENEKWQLLVQNEYGISSNWLELFSSAQLAIEAGVNTIEKEGIEPFIDTEGYEYLFE